MRKLHPALPIFLLLLLGACNRAAAPPEPDSEMVSIYVELAVAAGDEGEAAPDSVRQAIFDKYNTSQEEFLAALQVYREDPRGWVQFFRAVVDTFDAQTLRMYGRGPAPAPRQRPPGFR
jgi:hypothetical protein